MNSGWITSVQPVAITIVAINTGSRFPPACTTMPSGRVIGRP